MPTARAARLALAKELRALADGGWSAAMAGTDDAIAEKLLESARSYQEQADFIRR